MKNTERNQQILDKYMSGLSLEEVGSEFGITRQRVHQIVAPRTSHRHYGTPKRQLYDLKIREAFERVLAKQSTVEDEADALGILPDSLRVRFRAKGLELPRHESPLHGTKYRYNRGCRCDECREASRRHQRSLRQKEPRQHGTVSAYINFACRCNPCRKAGSDNNRQYRERRKHARLLHGMPTN